jgi:hypothetical protein
MHFERANIECHGIVGIVHYAWGKSLACVSTNKKAKALQGWGPLTHNLLDSKALKREKNNNPVKNTYNL